MQGHLSIAFRFFTIDKKIKLAFFLQAFLNGCGSFIATVMGHWIEPRSQSCQASNWLYGFHPRVSNSHWLHFPNAVVIKSASFSWFVKSSFFAKKWSARKRAVMRFWWKTEKLGWCWGWVIVAEKHDKDGIFEEARVLHVTCPKFTYKWILGNGIECKRHLNKSSWKGRKYDNFPQQDI